MWRACYNVLPTKGNLFKKKIVHDHLCPICELEEETTAHILGNCSAARDAWSGCNQKLQKCNVIHVEFIIVDTIRNIVTMKDFEVMVVVVCNLWLKRNSLIHGEDFGHPNQLVRTTMDSLQENKETQVRPFENSRDRPMVIQRWQAPSWGFVKVNWDATIDKHN